MIIKLYQDSPGGSAVKNPPAMQETQEMVVQSLGQEDPPGGGNGSPLQYSCRKIPWTEKPTEHTHTQGDLRKKKRQKNFTFVKKVEFVVKSLPTKKTTGLDGFHNESYQRLNRKI